GCRGSSRTTLTGPVGGSRLTISVHVAPVSCVLYTCGRMSSRRTAFTDTYATAASAWPASICDTLSHGRRGGGVTFFHDRAASRVTCTRPSSVPAQIICTSLGEGATASIT